MKGFKRRIQQLANGLAMADDTYATFPLYLKIVASLICTTILTLGTVGNILVSFVVIKTKELRNSTNIFLINLSFADLLVLIICLPTILIELHSQPEAWILGAMMCKAVSFMEMAAAHGSVLTILAISFERYYAICKPLKAGYKCTKMRAVIIITLIWFTAIAITIPMLFITELATAEHIDGSMVFVCLTNAYDIWHSTYFVSMIVIFFFLPLFILIIVYTFIAKHLILDSRVICSTSEKRQLKLRKQVVFMLAAVVVTFFVCLLPFRLLILWLIITSQDTVQQLGMETYYNLLYFCRIMLYLNSAINPLLYNAISTKFRDGFFRIFCHGQRLRSHGSDQSSSTAIDSVRIRPGGPNANVFCHIRL